MNIIKKEAQNKTNKIMNIMNIHEIEPKKLYDFNYKFQNQRPNSVLISGSFDKWQVKHPLVYDSIQDKWHISLRLKKGKHYFKFIIDGIWRINPNELKERGNDGIINNYVII